MDKVTMVGIDLAKNVFWLHGADERGRKVFSKKMSRAQLPEFVVNLQTCTIVMEACSSAHFWGRKFIKMGHEVKLISPQFVTPFVKSNKNDAKDSEAIVEAASRPSMRFVAVKTTEQQEILSLHRVREQVVGNKTALINELRGLLGEYGIIIPKQTSNVKKYILEILEDAANELTAGMRILINDLYCELKKMIERVSVFDEKIKELSKKSEVCTLLETIPGIGPTTSTAMAASVGNAKNFKNGRELSAWLGLVPKQYSSGGKQVLGRISKRGDIYVRKLLVHGARTVLRYAKNKEDVVSKKWNTLAERIGHNKACIAIANRNARVAWAVMTTGSPYRT